MPVYEFLCGDCNTIFSFLSSRIDTETIPFCPKCKIKKLKRQMSSFSIICPKNEGDGDLGDDLDFNNLGIDEDKINRALKILEKGSGEINEDDPKGAVDLMRKMTDAAGFEITSDMEKILSKMEDGEDPSGIKEELGSVFDENVPFQKKGRRPLERRPLKDETLYDLHG
ncbi:MAG: zinc ribbon domain-containing protein [Desulfobacterales bacterium]|nr:zinc ribbon domain-containing protein [Desulfobacterales bacterium]